MQLLPAAVAARMWESYPKGFHVGFTAHYDLLALLYSAQECLDHFLCQVPADA